MSTRDEFCSATLPGIDRAIRLLDRIGSIWFGVGLMIAVFVYSSIGSAVPQIRQGALADWLGLQFLRFEKSEMAWFSWWPFEVMIGLFCASLVVATVRRIPLRLVSAGVWATHAGIVVLAISSAVYFGRKVEGDVIIFHSRALILAPGMTEPESMVIRPAASINVQASGKRYQVSVARIDPAYEIPAGRHKGDKRPRIWLNVESSEPRRSFVRAFVLGYRQYTEDWVPGPQGLQRVSELPGGNRLLDEELQIELDYDEPVKYYYHSHSMPVRNAGAIYARFAPRREWTQLRISNLPHYSEWISRRDEVWPALGDEFPPLRSLDLRAKAPAGAAGFEAIELRVTDYLPFAELQSRWVPGGSALNPMVRFRLMGEDDEHTRELLALDARQNEVRLAEDFRVRFAWALTTRDRERLIREGQPRLMVRIESENLERAIELASFHTSKEVAVEGTDYKLELRQLFPAGMAAHGSPAVALLRVSRGKTSFNRVVVAADSSGGQDFDDELKPLPELVDPDIKLEYLDASLRLLLVAGPDDDAVTVAYTGMDGTFHRRQGWVGEEFAILEGLRMRIDALLTRARRETRPAIVPRRQRQPLSSVGKLESLIRVEVKDAAGVESVWLPFHVYPPRDTRGARSSRSEGPHRLRLSDGRVIELIYSRWRDPLPSPMVLDRFILESYPGGDREKDYISLVRFREQQGWSDLVEVKSNHPAAHGGLRYYQSGWDPEAQAYTVLGVGNRRGIRGMLAGVCLSIAGMMYTFYVKPALMRRRRSPMLTRTTVPVLAALLASAWRPAPVDAAQAPFAAEVDLEAFRLIAVQHEGRFKTFDTLAREKLRLISHRVYLERRLPGSDRAIEQDPVFTYLDLIFNPDSYRDVRLIHVNKRPLRRALTQAALGKVDRAVLDAIVDDGLVSLAFLRMPEVRAKLQEMRRDIMRAAKGVDRLVAAASWVDARALAGLMRVIPPPDARSVNETWYGIEALDGSDMPKDATHAGLSGPQPITGMAPEVQAALSGRWSAAREAWQAGDAAATGGALTALAAELRQVAPQVYPRHRKLALEHWYYKYHKMTWTWWFYMVAVVFLLMGIVYRWRRARLAGVAVFALAFCLHTVATGVRWYLAGRIPNANMFEAVTAAAWLGSAVAVFFELGPLLFRRRAAWRVAWIAALGGALGFILSLVSRGVAFSEWRRWGPAPTTGLIIFTVGTMALISLTVARRRGAGQGLAMLGASVVAMVALMCGRFMTIALDSDIKQPMPILHDLWLYLHVNMIILSYALIGISFVTAAMYLVGRLLTRPSVSVWASVLIPAAMVPLPALAAVVVDPGRPVISLWTVLPAWAPFLIVIVFVLVCHGVRLVGGRQVAARSHAVWDGLPVWGVSAAGPAGGEPAPPTDPAPRGGPGDRSSDNGGLARVLDGATMLLLELSFITLWVGIIMGAKWADHSWGRPWGWDPKEVFALNTWIIFLILVHVRVKVRDKALWTAVLAVIGCSVMLFNWIVVNYFITGLHSYA